MSELVVNRWRTPDGTILHSKHVHDYITYTDTKTNDTYMVDGGSEYCRTSVNEVPMENLCLYEDSDFNEIRKYYMRGTFDDKGNRIWKPLCEMSNKHIENCITYNIQNGFDENCKSNRIYKNELQYRENNNIVIEDNFKDE